MKGDHKQIRLGAAYGLVAVDAEESQEHLLYQVLDVGGAMAQAGRQKPAQPPSVLPLQVRNEGLLVAEDQVIYPVTYESMEERAGKGNLFHDARCGMSIAESLRS
jgi:hypothetical protein